MLHLLGGATMDLDIEQGIEMGRPSLLHVTARQEGSTIRVSVGGGVVPVCAGRISV